MTRVILPRGCTKQPTRHSTLNPYSSLTQGLRVGWVAPHQKFFGAINSAQAMSGNNAWVYHDRYGVGQTRRDSFSTALPQNSMAEVDGASNMTLLAIARPSNSVNSANYGLVSVGQNTSGTMFSIRTTDGDRLFYRGYIYIGGARYFGGSFSFDGNDRSVDVVVIRQIYNEEQALFLNGVKDPAVGNFIGSTLTLRAFGNYSGGPFNETYMLLMWDRALSDMEIKSISDNPYQIFLDSPRFIDVVAADIPVLYRAGLGLYNGAVVELNPGSGHKPLVLLNNRIQERVSDEGIPLILDQGDLRTLLPGETLQF